MTAINELPQKTKYLDDWLADWLLAVLAIQVFGGGIIENFAFAMLVGVIAGTYSSIYIASPLVLAMDNYFERRAERDAAIDEVLAQ